jgi:hypothetical protein
MDFESCCSSGVRSGIKRILGLFQTKGTTKKEGEQEQEQQRGG